MNHLPLITQELVDWLSKLFPNRCPLPSMTDREIWIAVGRQDVIKRLQRELDDPTPPE